MNVLVTGGRGFIGSFLVEQLLEKGYQVRCLLRNAENGLGWLQGLEFETSDGDMTDARSLEKAVAGVDYVFHLAALTKSSSKAEFFRINVEGTRNLLRAVESRGSELKRFVLISSLGAAGPSRNGHPMKEQDPPRPISTYGASKLESERVTLAFADAFPVSIVRPPTVFGPREKDVLGYFKYIRNGWYPVLTGGPRYSSLIYVKDLVDGMILIAENEKAAGDLFFLSYDQYFSWDELGELIAKTLNAHPRRLAVPLFLALTVSLGFDVASRILKRSTLFSLEKYRELKETHWICDSTKARRLVDFRCQYSLEQAIEETAEWYLENGWI
ncbi:MAG: NAD-dependent epimerase/dehydratase family protein [bacterium]